MKASRSKLPGMDILEEENEDETSAGGLGSSEPSSHGSLRGFVQQRVNSLEHGTNAITAGPQLLADSNVSQHDSELDSVQRDPRARTRSGQEELRNEWISPVTLSKQNTIRDRALKGSIDQSSALLHAKLEELRINDSQRPLSRSSDRYTYHGRSRASSDESSRDAAVADLTAQSLPDDLSMGTQDFISHGGYVNNRRGGLSNEGSFLQKTLSPSTEISHHTSSSNFTAANSHDIWLPTVAPMDSQSHQDLTRPTPPTTPRQQTARTAPENLLSSRSPLKLFGNRDTYTNNKLLRVLSHFEDAEAGSMELGHSKAPDPDENGTQNELRLSRFGEGDLDRFDFIEEVKPQTQTLSLPVNLELRIFSADQSRPMHQRPNDFEGALIDGSHFSQSAHSSNKKSHQFHEILGTDNEQSKRTLISPMKERTPKRRRTLLRQEIESLDGSQQRDFFNNTKTDSASLAGKKRKDARYDEVEITVDAETLAARQMLRPRMVRRRTSNTTEADNFEVVTTEDELYASTNAKIADVREAVAGELVQVVKDARKTSVTTQDYMEEATKIMQMIRAKGKPKSGLSSVEEPMERSELDPDAILDLDIDEASSGDDFSRPPSRDGGRDLREVRRQVQHDPGIASHLRKFKESEDLEILIDTSALEPTPAPDNAEAREAALVPIPEDEQFSSPPNVHIRDQLDQLDLQRKRKHSASTVSGIHSLPRDTIVLTSGSSGNSTQRTIPTSSSGSSGRKGIIPAGKVLIPDQIGTMTFDHAAKTWVKERRATGKSSRERRGRQATSEDDPFEHISDLSTDEMREIERDSAACTSGGSRPSTRDSAVDSETRVSPSETNGKKDQNERVAPSEVDEYASLRSRIAEHETLVHDGRVSRAPNSPENISRQPRVVTIAFSSPLVSVLTNHNETYSSDLGLGLVEDNSTPSARVTDHTGETRPTQQSNEHSQQETQAQASSAYRARLKSRQAQSFVGRPVSRIEELDENLNNEDKSLMRFGDANKLALSSRKNASAVVAPRPTSHATSLICLTPLSEFSLHQVDKLPNLEASYVGARPHPAALRQAHGSNALGVDDLMRAITDVEPSEPYWDDLRCLDLTGKRLTTLHQLEEYCSALEQLVLSDNQLGQLHGVPQCVRNLYVGSNHLSDLTSWSHLQNLQYLDISGNKVENLEGLACLHHLRELNANNNKIKDIDGILDLNGLQTLSVRGNALNTLDFEGGELTRLTRLDASCNQLASIDNLPWLPCLEDLNVDQNKLTEFAIQNSATLPALRNLRISDNKLRSIDLSAVPGIASIYLDRNHLTRIDNLDRARNLETLSLREQSESPNIIKHILSTPNDCRKLFLSSNASPGGKLELPHRPLLSLRYLELASCGISSLATGFGTMIPNCRVLNLNFNALVTCGQLQGMLHLNKLLLAGNRLERLRRSCIALSRHPALTKIDIRNNPLTVGFYSMTVREDNTAIHTVGKNEGIDERKAYILPRASKDVDMKWLKLLDDGTRLKRRTLQLLLAQRCADLIELDGLSLDREEILQHDDLWETLTEMGVLKRPMLVQEVGNLEEAKEYPSQPDTELAVGTGERSLTIE